MNKKRSVNREGLDLFFVYMHKVPNGKIYIGSSQRPFKRWNNGYGYIENKEFYNDITELGIAIAVNGETRPSSLSIFTPQAVEEFGTAVCTATVTVPKGCCFTVSVRYVNGVTDGTTTPIPTILARNANLNISRIA